MSENEMQHPDSSGGVDVVVVGAGLAGLKAQVLGRIEELEEREREREEMLLELVPAMEAWGYDTGDVKAVTGG